MPKIAEMKFSSCGHQKKLRLRNCGVAVAEQHFFKSCGIAITEVLPSSCGIAISDSKKKLRVPTSGKDTGDHPLGDENVDLTLEDEHRWSPSSR
jgi:hypothetical protein